MHLVTNKHWGFADNSAFSKGFERTDQHCVIPCDSKRRYIQFVFGDGRENNLTTMVLNQFLIMWRWEWKMKMLLVKSRQAITLLLWIIWQSIFNSCDFCRTYCQCNPEFLSEINSGRSKFELANGTTSNFTIQEARGKIVWRDLQVRFLS